MVTSDPANDNPIGIYRERAHLIAFLATQFPSFLANNDPHEPDYTVIYIHTPDGQLSWHIHPDDLDLFDHVPWAKPDDDRIIFDGHTTPQKYARLATFTRNITHEVPF